MDSERVRIESQGVAFRRERRARIAAWTALLGAVALTAWSPLLVGFTQLVVTGAGVFLLVRYATWDGTPGRGAMRPAGVDVDAEKIAIVRAGKTTTFARKELETGWLDGFAGQHHAVFRKRGGDTLWIRVRDVDEGRAVVRAAGFAADQQVFSTRLVSVASERLTNGARAGVVGALTMIASVAPALLVFLGIAVGSAGVGSLLAVFGVVVLLLAYPALRFGLSRTALVGTDGVTIKGFGHRRLIPFSQVVGASADERGVWLAHPDGSATLLATLARMKKSLLVLGRRPNLGAHTEVLLARVREAMAARGNEGASARFGALDRRGRPLDAWRQALAELGRREPGGGGYREAVPEADDLARVLEDGAAPAERRIAAAMALSTATEPGLQRRVRIAAGACADDALRVAIEKAAEGELAEDDLERALRVRTL